MPAQKYCSKQTIEAHLEKLQQQNQKQDMLPLFYELDRGKLMLFGTDNIGEKDEHSICRLGDAEIAYEGSIELRGHMAEGHLLTKGEGANIRVTGYICGESKENPARIIARDSAISLGDTNHPERRSILNAHIEAANGITIYKRPLIHVMLISHYEDAVLRGQIFDDVSITAPYVSLSASICKQMTIRSVQDTVMKGGMFTDCDIVSSEGEVFLCAGAIRNCNVTAKYDIEFSGHVDEFTLKHAKSEKGVVRSSGEPVRPGQRKRA